MRPDADMPEFLPQHDSAPWVPENAPTFKVGDRVRVTAGIAECQIRRDWVVGDSKRCSCMPMVGHYDVEHGLTGTVNDPAKGRALGIRVEQGHHVGVIFDNLVRVNGHFHAGVIYAPSELELIDTADAPERREDKPFHPEYQNAPKHAPPPP